MTPYYDDGLVTIYHGDSRHVLPHVVATHVVTDPPYAIDKDYGDNEDDWRPDHFFWRELHDRVECSLHMTVSNRHLDEWLLEAAEGGWQYLHTSVYWRETRQGGNWNGQFAYAWEPLLSFKKWSAQFRLAKRMMTDVFAHAGRKSTEHPAERDLGMWKSFIDHLPPGTILDPFLGSGTTLRACKDLGRRAIGIEREERWCETAANRCAQESLFVL